MPYRLGINTGFALNRYQEVEEWTRIIKNSGVNYVQFTADLLNVSLPEKIVKKNAERIIKCCEKENLKITSTFTGAFTRVNHLAHPDKDIQKYWINWFKKFIDLTLLLDSKTMGSHFGILTLKDYNNPKLRKKRISQNVKAWHEIANYGYKKGLKNLLWEPMSIAREYGETIDSCKKLNERVNKNSPLPFFLCLDVDHGDIASKDKKNINPYFWLKKFGKVSKVIHLKQSLKDKSGHYPFIKKYNKIGKIEPKKFLKTLKEIKVDDCDLILEISFREREPIDSNVEEVLKKSVNYWQNAIKQNT